MKQIIYGVLTSIAITILAIFGPFGPSLIQSIAQSQNIHLHGINTSLYRGSIHIQSAYYQDQHASIDASNITLYPSLTSGIGHIHADQVGVTIHSIPTSNTSSSFTQRTIDIDHLQIHTLPLLHSLNLYDIHTVVSHNQIESLYHYQHEPYSIKYTQSQQESFPLHHIALHYDTGFIELAALHQNNHWTITSNNESDLKNLHIHIAPEQIDLNINSSIHDQIFKAQGSISLVDKTINANIYTHITQPNFNLQLTSQIDSAHHFYKIVGKFNGSKIDINQIQDQAVFKLNLENLASITPYIEGDFQATADFSSDDINITAHSNRISLPMARLDDIEFSYTHKNGLKIRAQHLRNSLISIHHPEALLRHSNGDYIFSLSGIDSARALSTSPYLMRFIAHPIDDHYEVHVDEFNLTNSTQSWSLKQDQPMLISRHLLDTNNLTFISNKQSMLGLRFIYNLPDNTWTIHNKLERFNITFHSHELFDSDTEAIIHSMEANGQSTITKKPFSPIDFDGEYELTKIRADIINLVPSFLFPLDYHINDGSAHINSSGYDGKLHSNQGTLSIHSNNKMTQLKSDALSFNYNNHHLKCGIDLTIDNLLTSGQVEIFELTMSVEKFDGFLIFPRDVEIVGERNIVKPKPNATHMEIDIYANNAPFRIYGFNGLMNANIDLTVSKEGLETVSGNCSLKEPKLIFLNRLIPISHFEINFDHNRWLDGNLDIFISSEIEHNMPDRNTINRVDVAIGGTFNHPSENIATNPTTISKFEALLHLFSQSKQLPEGNENPQLIELISGLKQNEGLVFVVKLINNIANIMLLDISIRPGYDDNQSFFDNMKQTEIVLQKNITKNISIALRQQLFNETKTASIKYLLSPQTAIEGQISREATGLNLLYHN